MDVAVKFLIISISIMMLISASNLLPRGYAQSSSSPPPKSPCPSGSNPVGLACSKLRGYNLPGNGFPVEWSINIDGIIGVLNISSPHASSQLKDNVVKVQGTMWNGSNWEPYLRNRVTLLLCTISHPCIIDGTFDTKTGKISFKSTPTTETFVHSFQNYTGYLYMYIDEIWVNYVLTGIGKSFSPNPGTEFGWYATVRYGHP
jgi:hypothetical protein